MTDDLSNSVNSRPLVSVIIPCFRQGRYLADALDSVLAQTYPAVEVIVINDGSDDDTAEVAGRYGSKIRYHYQVNQGLAPARNTGIRMARGDYFLFLDADDVLHSEAVERHMEAMQGKKNRLCVLDYCLFKDSPPPMTSSGPCTVEPFSLLPGILDRCMIGSPGVCLFSREMVEAVGAFEANDPVISRCCEDIDFYQRLAFRSAEAVRIRFVGVALRLHQASISSNLRNMLRARTRVLLRVHRWIVADPILLNQYGQVLLRAEYRVRRRWLALGLEPSDVPALTQSIFELESRGVRVGRSSVQRFLHATLGGVPAERLVLKYFRWFKPKTFSDYTNHYN